MSDEQDKPTLTRKPLGLKRTVEAGQVQQQFSHGRRNTVVVEVKRRRVLGRPGAAPLSAFGSPTDGASAGAADQDKTPPRQGSSSPRGMAPSSAARRDRDA